MNRRIPTAIACLLASGAAEVPALAAPPERRLGQDAAIQTAMQHNPSLQAALLEVQQSQHQVRAEAGRFVPHLQLDGGYTHAESPRQQRDGTVSRTTTNTFDVGSQVSHQFEWGTALTLRVEGYRSTSTQQLEPGSADTVTLGPAYGTVGRLTLNQPLLRGAGTTVGEAALRQARLARTTAERAQDVAASQLLRDVLAAYWELWYRSRAVQIQRDAKALAEQQRKEAGQRAAMGALAPFEVLNYETRIAELDQAVESADAQRRQQAVEMGRLLGTREFDANYVAEADPRAEPYGTAIAQADAIKAALTRSPEVAQLEAQIAAAEDRVATAGESERPRLDLEAYVQSEQLAQGEVPPAMDHFGTRPAYSAHVGVVFELPLSGTTRSAERRVAELAVEAARLRLRQQRDQIEAQVVSAYVNAETARRRVALAETTVSIATQQVRAQRQRYAAGVAIFIEVQQAEDTLRQAELNVERARVDLVLAHLTLEHVTGYLLARHANLMPVSADTEARQAAALGYLAVHRVAAF